MEETRRQEEAETSRLNDRDSRDICSSLSDFVSPLLIFSLVLYALLMTVVVWSLLSARSWALANLATPQSIEQWQTWRDDVQDQQAQAGPVQRRVPRSAEPPALVLMRDYFGVSLIGAVLFATVLYWVVAWLVAGIMQQGDSAA
jgi:hypothetical protein